MGKYLNERQIGFDTNLIGFPNLGDCLAAVLQNAGGLFGFHIYGLGGRMDAEFAAFIQTSVGFHAAASSNLFGVCYWPKRYGGGGGATQWTAEMRALAQAIGYTGTISGFDTSNGTKIKRTDGTYVEFRLGGSSQCDVYYKRMSKVTVTDAPATASADIKLIRKDMAAMKAAGLTHDDAPIYTRAGLPGLETTSVDIVATKSNKGEFHLIKPSSMVTFTYP